MAGNIYRRGTDKQGRGIWMVRASAGTNPKTGKRITIPRTVHGTNRDAELELARLLTDIADGRVAESPRMTVAQWVAVWRREHMAALAGKTAAGYETQLENRILPALGHIPLNKLTPRHIAKFYRNLTEKHTRLNGSPNPLGGATQGKVHRVLSALLQEAVYRNLIPYNPVKNVKRPKESPPEIRYYDLPTVYRLMAALTVEPAWLRTCILLALTTGMRRGELVALEWSDIDLERGLVSISHAAQTITGKGQTVKEPKSRAGRRLVALPPSMVRLLREWGNVQEEQKRAAGSLWRESGYVWTLPDGSWLRADYLTREFNRFITRRNLPPLTFHGLRHTYASLQVARGTDIRTLSAIIGHANSSTTLDVYSHPMPDAVLQTATVMEGVFGSQIAGFLGHCVQECVQFPDASLENAPELEHS